MAFRPFPGAFLWKADPDKQQEFVAHYERQKAAAQRPGARRTRRYFVDACHPLWGLELVYACWLLVGQRFLAGMGSGRKRLNILGPTARTTRSTGTCG
jgi:hypothetical protein